MVPLVEPRHACLHTTCEKSRLRFCWCVQFVPGPANTARPWPQYHMHRWTDKQELNWTLSSHSKWKFYSETYRESSRISVKKNVLDPAVPNHVSSEATVPSGDRRRLARWSQLGRVSPVIDLASARPNWWWLGRVKSLLRSRIRGSGSGDDRGTAWGPSVLLAHLEARCLDRPRWTFSRRLVSRVGHSPGAGAAYLSSAPSAGLPPVPSQATQDKGSRCC
jgi:hypothetical protein